MSKQRPFEFRRDRSVNHDPTAVIETICFERDRSTWIHRIDVRKEFPMPMLQPFAIARLQAGVPIRDDVGGTKCGVGGAGNDRIDGKFWCVMTWVIDGRSENPTVGAVAGKLPGLL